MINSVLMTTQVVDKTHPILGFAHEWIAALAQRVRQLHVLTPIKGETNLPANVTVHHLTEPNGRISTIPNHLFHHNTYRRLVLGRQVDGVFVHMIPKWAIAAAPYCKLANVPLMLWYAHGHVPKVLTVSEKMVDAIVTSTPEGCRLNSPKLRVVGQGIDTDHFVPALRVRENGRFRIITVGRLSPVKNLERTLTVIHKLVHQHGLAHVQLDLIGGAARAGDDLYVAKLKNLVSEWQIKDNVRFVGTKTYDNIVPSYQNADLLLNLSQTNSLDKVALEAMACGTPVLTSNPAFAALMAAVDRSLFLEGAEVGETAVSLKTLIEKPADERDTLGLALREQVVQQHSIHQLASRFVQTLEQAKQ